MRPLYQTVEQMVRQVVARGAVNEVIHVKADNLDMSRELVQQLTSTFIENLTFTFGIIQLVKQQSQAAVADEAKFYGPPVLRANHNEEATSPSPPD